MSSNSMNQPAKDQNKSETLFKIVFKGKIKPGEEEKIVKERLASLYKVDVPRIDRIFERSPCSIHRRLTQEKALKFKAAIEKRGALCKIEVELPKLPPK